MDQCGPSTTDQMLGTMVEYIVFGRPYVMDKVEVLASLADLIEPEPERTCHVESWHYETEGDTTFIECELSCGHETDCFSIPYFCPRCGAKVVDYAD